MLIRKVMISAVAECIEEFVAYLLSFMLNSFSPLLCSYSSYICDRTKGLAPVSQD
jgi:hypothetical protein